MDWGDYGPAVRRWEQQVPPAGLQHGPARQLPRRTRSRTQTPQRPTKALARSRPECPRTPDRTGARRPPRLRTTCRITNPLPLTPLVGGARRSPIQRPAHRSSRRILLQNCSIGAAQHDHRRSRPRHEETRLTSENRKIRRALRTNGAEGTRTLTLTLPEIHKGLRPAETSSPRTFSAITCRSAPLRAVR